MRNAWAILLAGGALLLTAASAHGAPTDTLHRKTGKAIFIGAAAVAAAFRTTADAEAGVAPDPHTYLKAFGPAFGLADPADAKVVRDRSDERGRSARFRQHHHGVPVFAGEVIVNLDAAGQLKAMAGRIAPDLGVDVVPTLDAASAANIALEATAKWHRAAPADLDASFPELQVFDPRLLDGAGEFPPALVWHVEVKSRGLAPIDELLLVDAHSGSIALHFNQVHAALNRITYDANSGGTLPGTLVCTESNPDCTGGINDAVKAHIYAADTYAFYMNYHGRDSIDGNGMTVVSTVRYCDPDDPCPYSNAFWSGSQMVYGAGYSNADDVVAHELTHGVTRNESNLYYYYQSGAINESFSDVWGEFVDQTNGKGTDTAAVKWLIAEDIAATGFRNMSNPPAKGDPDRMLSSLYHTATSDNGGVHVNSGINNKAAFLMTDGGTFNGKTVTGLGLTKVAKIYYRVQTALLVSGSDYLDLYNALFQACNDLVGTDGITSTDCQQVRNATDAVEMNQPPASNFLPAASFCPVGLSVATTLFSDDFESGSAKWSFTRTLGSTNWRIDSGYTTSGLRALEGPAPSSNSDLRAAMASGVAIPSGAMLWFNHAFAFEKDNVNNFLDGGVLEYSIDAGATWIDAQALYAEGRSYAGTVASPSSNPLAGRAAFTAESHGYVSTRFDLGSLAGKTVRFRFRVGTDSTVSAIGWVVDDFRIHTCGPNATPAITSSASASFTVGSAGSFTVVGTGTPLPTFTVAGSLPSGVSFATASGILSGTPALGTVGSYPLTFTAKNGLSPDATQAFTLTVAKATQTLAFGAAPRVAVGQTVAINVTAGASTSPVLLSASPPALCAITGSSVKGLAAGTCTVAANQAADANYNAAAQVTQTFTIAKATQVIDFAPLPDRVIGAAAFSVAATGGASGLPIVFSSLTPLFCTVSGSTVTLLAVGTCTVAANQAGNSDYLVASTVTRSFAIAGVPAASLSAASLAFAAQSMGTTSAPQVVSINNTGSATLTINSVTASTAQFGVSHSCGSVAPASTCTVQVTFSPAAAAGALNATLAVSGTLAVASNSSGGNVTLSLSGTAEKSLVTHFYRSILRRAPDSAGKAFWQGEAERVAALGANVNETWFTMALSFYTSSEYQAFARDSNAFATDLYATFFNRAPDAAGLGYWTSQIAAGMPRDVVLASFMFSAEFRAFAQAIFGNTAARAEVDTVLDFYRGLLSRLPDSGGFSYWTGRFRSAQCLGATAVASEAEAISGAYAASTEYLGRNRSNTQYVSDLYNAFLRRGGDLEGVQYWIGQLNTGARTRDQLRRQFLASPEFNARVSAIVAQGCLS